MEVDRKQFQSPYLHSPMTRTAPLAAFPIPERSAPRPHFYGVHHGLGATSGGRCLYPSSMSALARADPDANQHIQGWSWLAEWEQRQYNAI
jgi:hypothetical protein